MIVGKCFLDSGQMMSVEVAMTHIRKPVQLPVGLHLPYVMHSLSVINLETLEYGFIYTILFCEASETNIRK